MKSAHPLWRTFRSLKGNQRALVVMEPLWSVPNNLFAPFASVYMAAIGLTGQQMGTTVSLGLALQLVWALLSGAITDKYGRRRMMLVFGLLSWAVPCMLWTVADGYVYFIVAVMFNSMWQVTGNCFACMLVEDGATDRLTHVWTLINLTGLVSGFMAPVAGLFIAHYTLVPTMRAIYLGSMAMMTIRFVWQHSLTQESSTGHRRVRECRGRSILTLTFSGWPVFVSALRHPRLLLSVVLVALLTCFGSVQTTFWPLFVTKAYGVSNSMLSVFPLVSSLVTLPVYLFVVPRIAMRSVRTPLLVGLGLHAAGVFMLLILQPLRASLLAIVFLSAICEAMALAILGPLTESIMSVVIPGEERARINSFISAVVLLISTPVGWISGALFQVNLALPLALNLGFMILATVVAVFVGRMVIPTPIPRHQDTRTI